jgi:hypothetical protein
MGADKFQQRYPGQFTDQQIRTLQRHIQVWRVRTVLTFGDDGGLDGLARQDPACRRRCRSASVLPTMEQSA